MITYRLFVGFVAITALHLATATSGLAGPPRFALPVGRVDNAAIGLWGTRILFPNAEGELTISRRGSGWRASLSGATVVFDVRGSVIHFQFPGATGGFRGTLDEAAHTISGFWIQTAHSGDGASGMSGADQAFASPLLLKLVSPGAWRGQVRPLKDTLTLFIEIHRDPDGGLVGEVRNPEFNFNGGATQYGVNRVGDQITFSMSHGGSKPAEAFKAILLHGPDRLSVSWPDLKATYELKRLGAGETNGFFPRPPGEKAYVYQQPEEDGDGWSTARAGDTGMSEAALERLVRHLIDLDPTAKQPNLIHSVLVAHAGKLVLEEYFHGFDRDQPHDTRSATKTFSSVLLGEAMLKGVGISPDSSPYRLMAGLGPFRHPDPRKERITLAQLLTHTSGLDCDDNDEKSPGAESNMQSQTAQPDWLKYALGLPMVHDPGIRYAYCSAGINLVGGALSAATGSWLPQLFDEAIARPLQFSPYYWDLAPNGDGYLGGGAFLRPRDLLKVGQVYLDRGVWRGRRIVTADWVARSTEAKVTIDPAATGLTEGAFGNVYFRGEDGFAWHLGTFKRAGQDHKNYAATGNGGQLLIVVPDSDLAVVFTAGNYGQGRIWNSFRTEIVPNEIMTAIELRSPTGPLK